MKNSAEKPASPPKTLSAEARKWWRDVMQEYEITDPAGRLLLQTSLEAFDRMRGAQQAISDDGLMLRDRFEQPKAHPMVVIERDARSAMLTALKAMNLDIEPLRDAPGRPPGTFGRK